MMKKFVLALIISLCLVLPFSVNALELEKSFETSFDSSDGYIYSMTSYDDSGNVDGYIIYGASFIKYDLNNKVVWNKTNFIPDDLKTTRESNFVSLEKINLDTNEVLWQKKISGYIYNYFYSYDNSDSVDGYLIYFDNESIDSDLKPGKYIIKYDLDGNVIWTKKNENDTNDVLFAKDSYGNWYEYRTYYSMASYYFDIYDLSTKRIIERVFMANKWLPEYLIIRNKDDSESLFVIGKSDNNIEISRYTLTGEKLFKREVDFDTMSYFSYSINSRNISGEYDGVILLNSSSYSGYSILKIDYGGNLIWKKELSYEPSFIAESYDSAGEFNGYIVTGYDEGNKKGYITKFTYPKKAIESKSSDVEVINDAYPGKTVTVKAKEKTGYVVKRIVVKDSSGKEIEVGSDGTFIMPDDDVSVEVVYEKKAENIITNPDTVSAIGAVLFLIMTIVSGTLMVKNNRKV